MKKLIKLILSSRTAAGWAKIKTWEKQYECRQKGTDELTLTPQHLIETLDKLTGGEALYRNRGRSVADVGGSVLRL